MLTMTGTHFEKKALEQKNQELIKAFSEKSRAHARLQKMYDRAKGTQDAQYMQHAAADDADQVIQSMHGPSFVDALRDRAPQRPASAHVRGGGVAQDMPQVYSHGRVGSYGGGAKNQAWSSQGSRGGQHPPRKFLNTKQIDPELTNVPQNIRRTSLRRIAVLASRTSPTDLQSRACDIRRLIASRLVTLVATWRAVRGTMGMVRRVV